MRIFRLIALFAVCFLVASNAQAAMSQFYAGGKIGLMLVDATGFDDAVSIGVVAGKPVTEIQLGTIAVEGELTTTVAGGDVSAFGFSGDWDVTTVAAYGVYRSYGEYFFKGKAGLLYEDVDVDFAGSNDSDSDLGLSLGIGGGWNLSEKANLELEYTIIESDLGLLSLGFNMNF